MAGMRQDKAVDGFRLAYDRTGQGPAVLLLHGWPGDRTDYRAVVPLLSAAAEVIVPDLRGFGESDKHEADPATQYNAAAQARSILGLIEELELRRPVIAGYDVGSRVAQAIARERPDLVRALVVAPPLPGIGERILDPRAQREFWYQSFHNLGLCPELIDGKPDAVRSYRVRGAGGVHRLDRLVPGRRRFGSGFAGRAGTPTGPADRGADDGAVAFTRSAVPARMVRPDRRLLRGGHADPAGRLRSFHADRVPGRVRQRRIRGGKD
jgi:pimeloyl-ACP methyl ester carboxylesterase